MAGQTIDYDALAKQAGAVSSVPPPAKKSKIDYDALAKQAGALDSTPAPPTSSDGMPTGVIGVPGGGALPGFPEPPNPIQKEISDQQARIARLPKRAQALAQESGPGGPWEKAIKQAPGEAVDEAKSNAKETVTGVRDTVRDWWQPDNGFFPKVGQALAGGARAIWNVATGPAQIEQAALDKTLEGHPADAAINLIGGNADKANKAEQEGRAGAVLWDRMLQPLALGELAETGAAGLGKLGKLARGERFANSNFAKVIAPGFKGDTAVSPYDAAVELRPLYQKEAADMGMKDESLLNRMFGEDMPTRSTPGGKSPVPEPVEGMKKGIELANRVVDRTHAPIDAIMQKAGTDPISPKVQQDIVDALKEEQKKASRMGAKHAGAYQQLIDRVEGAKTFGEVNQIKQDANKMIEGVLQGGPSANAALSVEPIIAWKTAGDIIRQNMYPELQRYVAPQGSPGYFSIADAGRREALAMDARDGIYRNRKIAEEAGLSENAKKYLEQVAEGSMYKTHVLRRALKILPTPAGEFNKTFRRGLGTIGEGAKPESVTVNKQQLKLPAPVTPPPAYEGRFDIPTGVPKETTVGAPQVTPQQQYLGKRTVPNPNFSPMEGPSHLQQEQELGSTAHTIPDRVRGAQSPARVRADQVGVGHVPHPDSGAAPRTLGGLNPPPVRSITGPQTVEASNWQYLTGAKEPPQTIARNGAAVLRTGSPEIAKVALDDMRKFAGSKEFKALPKDEQMLHRDTLAKLEGQMKDYDKWKAKNPLPPPPGKEPEFEVWLNPGVAGKVSQAKGRMARRVAAHSARAIGQAGLQTTPASSENDMKAITEEQERRMRQPE
jgi:hypothetical protein